MLSLGLKSREPRQGTISKNERAWTIRLLEDYTEINVYDLGLDSDFLDMTPKTQMKNV